MKKLAKIVLNQSFPLIVSVVAVYALFLSAILQLSGQLSLKSRLSSSIQSSQVLGKVSSPPTIQPPGELFARNQRCIAGGTVNVDLFWRLDPWTYGYWVFLYDGESWQKRWITVKAPTKDGLISLTWQGLKPNSFYYWTVIGWNRVGFSGWAPIQYFQTVRCR